MKAAPGQYFSNTSQITSIFFWSETFKHYFCAGEMAERSNAAVLKTVEVKASGGSNPSLSAFAHRRISAGGRSNLWASTDVRYFFIEVLALLSLISQLPNSHLYLAAVSIHGFVRNKKLLTFILPHKDG
jgi:hypothetical protein